MPDHKDLRCRGDLNISNGLKNDFYHEVRRILSLNLLHEHQNLIDLIDTNKMTFTTQGLYEDSIPISPDSLLTGFQRTKDSSVNNLKKILLKPGNALLVHTVDINDFSCSTPLRRNLSEDEKRLFNSGSKRISIGRNSSYYGNIAGFYSSNRLFSSQKRGEEVQIRMDEKATKLEIFVDKRYTIFGQFITFKGKEN